jgi:hypothetical protein
MAAPGGRAIRPDEIHPPGCSCAVCENRQEAPSPFRERPEEDAGWHRQNLERQFSRQRELGEATNAWLSEAVIAAIRDLARAEARKEINARLVRDAQLPAGSPGARSVAFDPPSGAPVPSPELKAETLDRPYADRIAVALRQWLFGGNDEIAMQKLSTILVATIRAVAREIYGGRHLAETSAFTPEPGAGASYAVGILSRFKEVLAVDQAWGLERVLDEIREARIELAASMIGAYPPGLVAGIAKLSASVALVRATLLEALGESGPGRLTGPRESETLVEIAERVRERFVSLRAFRAGFVSNARELVELSKKLGIDELPTTED